MTNNSDLVIIGTSTFDLATEGPDAVIDRLLQSMQKLDESFAIESAQNWADSMLNYTRFCGVAEEKFSTAQAVSMAYMKRRWNDLPLSFRKQHNLNFYDWAIKTTGKSITTIDNHLRAIETFFFDNVAPKMSIDVLLRDKNNKIILDPVTGKPLTESREWNPMIPPISKLVLARSRAASGQMKREHWSMLMDSGCTFEQLQAGLAFKGGDKPTAGIYYRVEGTGLYAVEGGESVAVGELNFKDFYDNPDSLESRSLKRLLLMLGINLDEAVMLRQQAKREIDDAYPQN